MIIVIVFIGLPLLQLQSIFVSVPFIDEWLEGIEEPTNEEWAEAYEAWSEALSTFEYDLKVQYRDDEREDRLSDFFGC